MLSYGFPEPAEVCDKFLIVLPGVDIEAVPEVAPDGNASESPFSDLLDVVKADASFGDNLAVYDAASGCSVQFVGREGSLVSFSDMLSKMFRSRTYSHVGFCSTTLSRS